jgi:Na+/H+-dicarboxylate symporter
MAKRLTYFILIALVAGIVVGYGLHQAFDAKDPALATIADLLKLLPDVFLRLIKMIIAPLIMATIVTGIAGMGDSTALGRIGGKALIWFVSSSLVSLLLGMVLVNLFQPGAGLALSPATAW